MTHYSSHYQFTVDHHSEEGRSLIASLRKEVRARNRTSDIKQRVVVAGLGDRVYAALAQGKPRDTYYKRNPPLRYATSANVYIYDGTW